MPSDYHTIRLAGLLGIERYPELQSAFRELPQTLPVLVDLREGTGVDSLFLSELLLFKRRHPHPVAVLIPTEGNVPRTFAVAGMSEKVDVHTDLDQALRALTVEAH